MGDMRRRLLPDVSRPEFIGALQCINGPVVRPQDMVPEDSRRGEIERNHGQAHSEGA
jgi:hypothetical protein